ncbi:MAG TPA: 1-acyl-sn-glycerol-3-phosphate acyltransferase [Gemmatimonadales bacterium]
MSTAVVAAPSSSLTYDPFDADYCRALERGPLGAIIEHYFRARVVGAERIPHEGPVILAANHSGNAFPHDGIVLDALLWRRDGLATARKFRSLYEHELTLVWWMRPFGIDNFWRRGGGVDMTFDNFARLLERKERLLYFPEGVPGIGKGFNHRYQLQSFKTSFVLLAARYNAPIYPVYCINSEWVHPFGYTFRPLDTLMQRVFHVPFLPLPIGLLAVIFPWMWYLAFPAKMTFVVGQPIDVRALLWREGVRSFERPERPPLNRVAGQVRRVMQAELTTLVQRYGNPRYEFRTLLRHLRAAGRRMWRVLPLGWPIAYIRQERDRHRPPARSRLHALLRDWDLLFYYMPLGWPFLSLARALRRPPCGYRGLSREQARQIRGDFLWKLSERPLPPRDA